MKRHWYFGYEGETCCDKPRAHPVHDQPWGSHLWLGEPTDHEATV